MKYCFRYNARNRALARGETGEPIDLEAMPRPHRRRREKKLMTMDEVNERFPLTKYKMWMASRADAGLPTAGGVAQAPSRAASVRNAPGTTAPLPASPTSTKHSTEDRPATATSTRPAVTSGEVDGSTASAESVEKQSPAAEATAHMPTLTEVDTAATRDHDKTEFEEDEEDHIHDAIPPEMLTTPGDTCAICIDTIEEDDDIRGLTCGHAFHAGCLDPWLTSRRACCPLCKADYYVPKPRPEGETSDVERPRRTGRLAMPQPPPTAWTGMRGNPRMIFPGRFMSSPMYPGDGYGFPQGDGRRRAPRRTRRTAPGQEPAEPSPSLPQTPATDDAATTTRGLAARFRSANPFGARWLQNVRLPDGARFTPGRSSMSTAPPAPTPQLQEVVVR